MTPDDITQAVLARDDVARYLGTPHGAADPDARQRLTSYLEELRTRQRYKFYRALQHPLYPILRKVERVPEGVVHARQATTAGGVVYVSNHKSHLDYLVEPLVLDDHGIRPPVLAAGINLFGGALGLLHKHVTGAIPIRRNSKDPLYLVTLKAFVAETLKRRDLLYYAEGGRSYTGELKPPKTGLLQAALHADIETLSIVPMAVSYDIVLEARILSRQALRPRAQPFAQEVAEMARLAVGYHSRAFVTFRPPVRLSGYDPGSRRSLVALARHVHEEVGKAYKVLPTALVAHVMAPGTDRTALVDRVGELITTLDEIGANLATTDARKAVEEGVERLAERDIVAVEGPRVRVKNRLVLRYHGRTLQHLLKHRRRVAV